MYVETHIIYSLYKNNNNNDLKKIFVDNISNEQSVSII